MVSSKVIDAPYLLLYNSTTSSWMPECYCKQGDVVMSSKAVIFPILLCAFIGAALASTSSINTIAIKPEQGSKTLYYIKFVLKSEQTQITAIDQKRNLYKIIFHAPTYVRLGITNSAYFTTLSPDKFFKNWGKFTYHGPVIGFFGTTKQNRLKMYYFKMSNLAYNRAKGVVSVDAKFIPTSNNKTLAPLKSMSAGSTITIGWTSGPGEISQAKWKEMGYPLPCNGKVKTGQWFCK